MLSPVSASPLLGCIAPESVCDRLSPVLCQQLKVRATIALAVSSMSDKPSDLALVSVLLNIFSTVHCILPYLVYVVRLFCSKNFCNRMPARRVPSLCHSSQKSVPAVSGK